MKNEINQTIAALSYVKKFAGSTVLIKLGGAALEEPKLVRSICQDLSLIRSVGVSVVLVHGGGPAINRELTARGITWEFVDGQRVTTPEMMDVIEMVLCGHVNRKIVRTLNHSGIRAVGLSGMDGNMLYCKPSKGNKLGLVGTVEKVDPSPVRQLLTSQESGMGTIPVVAPVGVGRGGQAYNINADWAACRIAEALGVKKMLFLTDQEGILDSTLTKVIPELDAGELEQLIESGTVKGGMLAKVQTILHALRHGVTDVHVLNARKPHGLIEELFTDSGVGTVCRLRSRAPQSTTLPQPPVTAAKEVQTYA